MAKPIPFQVVAANPAEALRRRLDNAPAEHAAALLAACDLLQQLHDRGILGLLTTSVAASDQLLDSLVGGLDNPESVRALRNLLLLKNALGRIEPEALQRLLEAIPDRPSVVAIPHNQPIGLWQLLRRAFSQDSRRGLMAAINLLEGFGRQLPPA